MNKNIRSTGNDWEIEHTDKQQELYAHEQGKRLVKLSEIHGRERFYIDGQVGTFWNGGPVMTEGENPEPGYVCVSEDRKNNVWYPNNTIVQLVEEPVLDTSGYRAFMSNRSQIETNAFKRVMDTDPNITPVPDAIVDTVVAEESVKADMEYHEEDIYDAVASYRAAHPEIQEAREWAKQQLDSITLNHVEVMEKVPTEEAIKYAEMNDIQKSIVQSYEQYIAGVDPFMTKGDSIAKIEVFKKGINMDNIPSKELMNEMYELAANQYNKTLLQLEDTPIVYNSLEQILADIWKIETREITIQELAMKVQRTINSGAYIQQDGRE